MDAASLEVVFDPSKCSKLSIDQKRELVYEISKWSDAAEEILHAWTRHEILQILCLELGKERKYTGLTKSKIIEHLLKIVYEKKSQEPITPNVLENGERTAKRQRKTENHENSALDVGSSDSILYCKNSACKAKMNRGDVFCKRCSCCICCKYDDNKDPSLWLICNSDPPFHGVSCGISCHLECALKRENYGLLKDRRDKGLDGSFGCVSCGKVNDLLGSWRKQLLAARDTRRVDILCYRLSLAQKILVGTKHYQNLSEVVDEAVEKLEEEMGPLTGLPVKKARGIVNRLSLGPEIQRVCASAIESLDLMLCKRLSNTPSDCKGLKFKTRNSEDKARNTNCSSLSNPSSVEDETNNDKNAPTNLLGDTNNEKETSGDVISLLDEEPNGDAHNVGNLQITPCKLENLQNNPARKSGRKSSGKGIYVISKRDEEPHAGSSSKKRRETRNGNGNGNGLLCDKDLEYCVKVVRGLECDGYVDSTFRQKFLTWYGLRATREEVRVVKVFVDTFIEDPESLAGQLVDTFSDVVSDKRRCCKVPSGFCLKLWH